MRELNFNKHVNFTYEQIEKLKEAMSYLSSKQKLVLHLRFWDNMTINEISRQIGLSWKSTDQVIDSAINHLRIRILQYEQVYDREIEKEIFEHQLKQNAA